MHRLRWPLFRAPVRSISVLEWIGLWRPSSWVEHNAPGDGFTTRRVASELSDAWQRRLDDDQLATLRRVLGWFPISTWGEAEFERSFPRHLKRRVPTPGLVGSQVGLGPYSPPVSRPYRGCWPSRPRALRPTGRGRWPERSARTCPLAGAGPSMRRAMRTNSVARGDGPVRWSSVRGSRPATPRPRRSATCLRDCPRSRPGRWIWLADRPRRRRVVVQEDLPALLPGPGRRSRSPATPKNSGDRAERPSSTTRRDTSVAPQQATSTGNRSAPPGYDVYGVGTSTDERPPVGDDGTH